MFELAFSGRSQANALTSINLSNNFVQLGFNGVFFIIYKLEVIVSFGQFNDFFSQLKVSAGAGFIVALTGAIMTMPGLPKVPASEKIDVDKDGNISGLF